MHYLRHEHSAARKVIARPWSFFATSLTLTSFQFLVEAIEISRLEGDKETLQLCQGFVCFCIYGDPFLTMS